MRLTPPDSSWCVPSRLFKLIILNVKLTRVCFVYHVAVATGVPFSLSWMCWLTEPRCSCLQLALVSAASLEPLTCRERCSCWRSCNSPPSATSHNTTPRTPEDKVSLSTARNHGRPLVSLNVAQESNPSALCTNITSLCKQSSCSVCETWMTLSWSWCVCVYSVRCYPVMLAELAWLFATRPVFLYPELLPCASLDPALYCPRRTSAFTAAEDW